MPFYDGIGVIAEKHAVVLDVGAALCKVGYAGEPVPRAIVRTPGYLRNAIRRLPNVPACENVDLDLPDTHTVQNDVALIQRDQIIGFVHKLYFEHLLVNPKDRRVVLVEQLLGDLSLRDLLVSVLFEHFEVLSVLLAPSHLMPLFGLGLQSALVLDVGYAEATLVPITYI